MKPGHITRLISQIDLPPTLFDVLGMEGDDHFFGSAVASRKNLASAFISNYQSLGYYKQDVLTVLKPKQYRKFQN